MRGSRLVKLAVALLSVAAAVAVTAPRATAAEKVTAAAVWRPGPGFMERFHKECDGRSGTAFEACFAASMAKAGASPEALAFARRLDKDAYLQALDNSGSPVAVAHVFFPFSANENSAWFLVNGTPALINVDDRRYLDLAPMRAAAAYRAIARRYPNVMFWQGDRGAAGPQVLQNGRKFVVDYLLRDLCHACAVIGRVRYAFEFDAEGKFLGTRLVSAAAADR